MLHPAARLYLCKSVAQVRQSPGGSFLDRWIRQQRYYVVCFDTHSARFTANLCASKEVQQREYTAALEALLSTDSRFMEAHTKLVGQRTQNEAEFHRVPQGIFRNMRKASMSVELQLCSLDKCIVDVLDLPSLSILCHR